MQKVFVGAMICCLMFVQVQSQQQQVKQTLKSIRKDVDHLLKYGKLDTVCNAVLTKYKNSLPNVSGGDLDNTAVQKLLSGNADFSAATGVPGFKAKCNYKLINQFIDSVQKLGGQLKVLGATTAGLKDARKAVQTRNMIIQVLDDSLESPVNADLQIDSLNDGVSYLRKAVDSAGYFYAALLAGKPYQLTVTANGYKPHRQQLIAGVGDDAQTAVIRLATEPGGTNGRVKSKYEQELMKGYVDDLFHRFTILFVLISVVSLVLSTVNLLYAYSFHKWYRASMKKVTTMAESETAPPEEAVRSSGDEIAGPSQPLVEAAPESAVEEIPVPVPAPAVVPEEKYFLSEILITAGPRKKSMSDPDADKDLGEDVCGFVSNGRELFLWLLDGTSDLHCLKNPEDKREYFSSRLLAQSIANKLRTAFLSKDGKSLDQLILQAIQEVKKVWLVAIEKLPVAEKEILKSNIEQKNIPECATTLLIGQLAINGDMTAYRSGDSKMFLFSTVAENSITFKETSLSDKNDEMNDRVFFRLVLGAEGAFDILFNVPKYEMVQEKGINTLIAFSDGIGPTTEALIKKQYGVHPDTVREEIIYHAQGTADDKSICFVEIKG